MKEPPGSTPKYLSLGLTGFPLVGSRSPGLHLAALAALDLPGEYRLYPLPPLPEAEAGLAELVQGVRSGAIQGLNVTIPHKQAVIPHLDGLTEGARAIGAVNTIFREGERAIGDNTDAPGFLRDLKRLTGVDFEQGTFSRDGGAAGSALVLGAGGAARAVVYALWRSGWRVTLAARRLERSQALVESFRALPGISATEAGLLEALPLDPAALVKFLQRTSLAPSLLVNASSAGMLPRSETSAWPRQVPLPKVGLVYDLVYKPPETTLMRAARQEGLKAANGLGMLVEQAALSLERWTGRPVPRRAMWQAVEANPGVDHSPILHNEEYS